VLLVIYTAMLEECRAFYTGLGLVFVKERHGAGPEHYAAELPGLVFELYPATGTKLTGSLRLGFDLPATAGLPLGRHLFTDPEARVVEVVVSGPQDVDGGQGVSA
jgi:catechol 2,3-dioxygenase-like lactoylglutathione lyase family enzyme